MKEYMLNKKPLSSAFVVASLLVLIYFVFFHGGHFSTPIVNAAPLRPISPEEERQINAIRPAGLYGDRSQIPLMVAVLASPAHPHPLVVKTALHALSRLGAVEALPAIEDLINREGSSDVGNYARIAKARLLAESGAKGVMSSPAQAASKVGRFYSETGLGSADLNSATSHYRQHLHEKRGESADTLNGVYAVREIADIVYAGVYKDYTTLPGVAQVNFQADLPSSLKMRFAPLSHKDRVNALIQDLSHQQYNGEQERLEIQLAADEGLLASHTAANQLRYMDVHRDQFPREGFNALLSVLDLVADSEQTPLVEHFLHDADGYIASFARGIYPAVQKGKKGQIAPDY